MQGKLLIAHVPADEQPADLLTKAVSKRKFLWLKGQLKIHELYQDQKESQKGKNTPAGIEGA